MAKVKKTLEDLHAEIIKYKQELEMYINKQQTQQENLKQNNAEIESLQQVIHAVDAVLENPFDLESLNKLTPLVANYEAQYKNSRSQIILDRLTTVITALVCCICIIGLVVLLFAASSGAPTPTDVSSPMCGTADNQPIDKHNSLKDFSNALNDFLSEVQAQQKENLAAGSHIPDSDSDATATARP